MRSPLTGTVVERAVTPGQSVGGDPAQVLFTVADLDMLQVVADLYERDLSLVKEGQFARVNVEAYSAMSFSTRHRKNCSRPNHRVKNNRFFDVRHYAQSNSGCHARRKRVYGLTPKGFINRLVRK